MTTLLDLGTRAPRFSLPGVEGRSIRLYRLADCVADGPALLAFVPDRERGREHAPTRVAAALSWFDLIEGVTPLVVADESSATHRRRLQPPACTAPLLGDGDLTVGTEYGVAYDSEVVVYLVDASGVVRARWRTPLFDDLDLTAVKDATRHVATPRRSINT